MKRFGAFAMPVVVSPEVWAGLLGFGYFVYAFGVHYLNPTWDTWLYHMDRFHAYIGWAYFRYEPWTVPLGAISKYAAPLGTTIGFTDSAPIVAVLFKLLSPILPSGFQYFGLFLASCYVLGGSSGALLGRTLGLGFWGSLLLGVSVVLFPAMYSGYALAISARWVIVLAFVLYVESQRRQNGAVSGILWGCLAFVAVGIHPYLGTMVIAIGAASSLGSIIALRMRGLMAVAGATLGISAGVLAALGGFGYLNGTFLLNGGFEQFAANLNFLYNPYGFSSLVPSQPVSPSNDPSMQTYLGAGILTLLALLVPTLAVRPEVLRKLPPFIPLMVACLLMAVYSVSHNVYLNDQLIATIPEIKSLSFGAADIFRFAGKYLAPLALLLTIVAVAIPLKVLPIKLSGVVVAAALLLSLAERRPLIDWLASVHADIYDKYDSPIWAHVPESVSTVEYLPPAYGEFLCVNGISDVGVDWPGLMGGAVIASRSNTPYFGGALARTDLAALGRLCRTWSDHASTFSMSTDRLYIVSPFYRDAIRWYLGNDAVCVTENTLFACLSGKGSSPLLDDFITKNRSAKLDPGISATMDFRRDQPRHLMMESARPLAPGGLGVKANAPGEVAFRKPISGPLSASTVFAPTTLNAPIEVLLKMGSATSSGRVPPEGGTVNFTPLAPNDQDTLSFSVAASSTAELTIQSVTLKFSVG